MNNADHVFADQKIQTKIQTVGIWMPSANEEQISDQRHL
jgi:hypothetical protein